MTYYVLKKFEADLSDEFLRRGEFEANVIFRGIHYGTMQIPGYKEDFCLVPKEDEKYFWKRLFRLIKNHVDLQ